MRFSDTDWAGGKGLTTEGGKMDHVLVRIEGEKPGWCDQGFRECEAWQGLGSKFENQKDLVRGGRCPNRWKRG